MMAQAAGHAWRYRLPSVRRRLVRGGLGDRLWGWLSAVVLAAAKMVLVWQSGRERRFQAEIRWRNRLLLREIGRRRHLEMALRRAGEQEKYIGEAKTRYLRTMSHELRTPLNSIMGYAELLWHDARIPPHRKQAIKTIQQSSEHLLALVENSLDIASIESGHLKLLNHPFGFHALLEQLVHMFALQARGKALHFQFEAVHALPLQVKGDEQRVRQILINLLGNAIKFTEQGEVRFLVRYQNGLATFQIQDSGIGIAAEQLPRLFDPFVARGDGQFSGTGLGLGISKMLVECMGGKLELSSVVGQGTCVDVSLPLPQWSVQQETLLLPQFRHRLAYVGGRRSVLLLDDARLGYAWVADRLSSMGFALAMEQAEAFVGGVGVVPDAVLLNGDLPDRVAWHVLQHVRQWAPEVPVAVVSIYVGENDRRQTEIHWPGVRFFQTPLRFEVLLDWLGENLHLIWVAEAELMEEYTETPVLLCPSEKLCRELRELLELGHTRGIAEKLDEIEASGVDYAGFVHTMRGFLRNFAFDAMKRLLAENMTGTVSGEKMGGCQ